MYSYQTLGVVVLLLGLFGGGIYLFYKYLRKLQTNFGNYINKYVIRDHISHLALMLLSICAAESIYAAVLGAGDGMDPWARGIQHATIGLGSFILAIVAPRMFIQAAQAISELVGEITKTYSSTGNKRGVTGNLWWITIIQIIIAIITVRMMIVLPFQNVKIIAKILGEGDMLELAIRELNPLVSANKMVRYYEMLGYPEGFNAIDGLSSKLYITFTMFQIHLVIGFLDGLHATVSWLRGEHEVESNINQRMSNRSNNVTFAPNDLEAPLLELIKFTGIYNRDRPARKKAKEVFDKYMGAEFSNTSRGALAAKVGNLITTKRAIEKELADGLITQSQYEAKKSAKTNEIKALFSKSTSNGEGFGSPLAQGGTP